MPAGGLVGVSDPVSAPGPLPSSSPPHAAPTSARQITITAVFFNAPFPFKRSCAAIIYQFSGEPAGRRDGFEQSRRVMTVVVTAGNWSGLDERAVSRCERRSSMTTTATSTLTTASKGVLHGFEGEMGSRWLHPRRRAVRLEVSRPGFSC